MKAVKEIYSQSPLCQAITYPARSIPLPATAKFAFVPSLNQWHDSPLWQTIQQAD
jgi:hypothetical protein